MENAVRGFLSQDQRMVRPAVRIHTAMDATHEAPPQELVFACAKFFGGEARNFPPPSEWNDELLPELRDTKQWVLEHRATRRIRLSGNRRLSASVAFGSVFSAVAGFTIDMIGRDDVICSTDAHARADTPTYELMVAAPSASTKADQLVVSIGVPRDISGDVQAALSAHGLQTAARLHLHGSGGLAS